MRKQKLIEVETGNPRDEYKQIDVDKYCKDILELHKSLENEPAKLKELQRKLCQTDLYYLGYFILGINSMHHEDIINHDTGKVEKRVYRPFVFNRCWEVQNSPDYHVDIWARGHFKSVIITELKTIQDILINPNITIGIYSYNATIARSFVAAIRSFMENPDIQRLFPDIIPSPDEIRAKKYILQNKYGKNTRKKLSWSDESFSVKRTTTKKEETLMGYGLVTGQAVSKHFDILVFDDCVTPDSVRTDKSNATTTQQWQQAINTGEGENQRVRVIGTRYSFYDTYYHIINPRASEGELGGGKFSLRKYPCYEKGNNGERIPVLRTKEYLEELEDTMLGYVWSAQQECNPSQSSPMRFMDDWIAERCDSDDIYNNRNDFNWYIMIDPANTKSNKSDYTSMMLIGTGKDKRYYVPDMIRDRLTQSERKKALFSLVNKWTTPNGKKPIVFEEQSGLLSDMEYFRNEMIRDRFFFELFAVTTRPRISADLRMSGMATKHQRIHALEPMFRTHRIVLAKNIYRTNYSGNQEDMMASFVLQEYNRYPYGEHDDCLDALSRIADAETGPLLMFPDSNNTKSKVPGNKTKKIESLCELENSYIPF